MRDNASAIYALKPHACAEINKHVISIASASDELKLLSSLNSLGYIELEVFYNLNSLKDRLVRYADLSWFCRHTYHVIGKYDDKGQFMVHRAYICTNLNFSFVEQHHDQLRDYKINMTTFSNFALGN